MQWKVAFTCKVLMVHKHSDILGAVFVSTLESCLLPSIRNILEVKLLQKKLPLGSKTLVAVTFAVMKTAPD
ncbi:hypothetical protein K2173_011000 [Erythroxylum novogranatense]|uniref:Uncharacterized protein n=1 Tax=Erythroxylum novogranatense TaxID=1862640 RepID=A0AAV8T195_9ROSI|nr:hypothetical protein K2173_011000 [Erythroxylum novogranatense]